MTGSVSGREFVVVVILAPIMKLRQMENIEVCIRVPNHYPTDQNAPQLRIQTDDNRRPTHSGLIDLIQDNDAVPKSLAGGDHWRRPDISYELTHWDLSCGRTYSGIDRCWERRSRLVL
jgi:hypothetical protein